VNRGTPRSTEHRTVLALFSLDGLSHCEVAETLGIPEGTVWSRLHLARKKLAVELEALGMDF
jgi:RNA polymerase sigma-70 factor (ECF subfamily)